MQKPDVRFSARKLLDSFGHYVPAQLRAKVALAGEAETFAAAQGDLSRRLEEYHQAVGLAVQQIAARDAVHDSLVETVRTFHFAVCWRTLAARGSRTPTHGSGSMRSSTKHGRNGTDFAPDCGKSVEPTPFDCEHMVYRGVGRLNTKEK